LVGGSRGVTVGNNVEDIVVIVLDCVVEIDRTVERRGCGERLGSRG
jgi:hypothetical protein